MRIIGAGRTDSGVHAEGQVVNFKSDLTVPIARIPLAMNSLLPRDIRIIDAREVSPEFHARYSAVEKTYRYQMYEGPYPSVFLQRFAVWSPGLNWQIMEDAHRYLVGTHDFAGFAATGSSVKTTVRSLTGYELRQEGSLWCFRFTADGFLYNMVRNIIGTLIEIGLDKRSLEDIANIIVARDRSLAGATAPPHGLVLESILYPKETLKSP